ncbi:phospholipase/carboxylesterase family protein (macronuclear) [Tetrahymena thermophila SB210]|uniref:Phospholipase/carboxylesterase family protein n=1 Tax=Tetrahymena thermophila (strain SB210) TaxID=312017 RepID=I7M2B9_TETTS|nr:phospholipase/carboxylesterase family protein [Tetrahymena thermophila SB210]EAR99711.2 phospholipase/carboxylesterase family protein [Tetrahymena thermophila SB210]|eukprot:XP_001019956.2 phospholipase/carboxylesterase family protein [Tetrahymena thermophila SB210]
MLQTIEIVENFDDLNTNQKYQLKVPLYRNDKQYINDLENNVNYFMNQIGKNNYITQDQMEVVMPRYQGREKKRRVNRARMQEEKIKREIQKLRQEEKIFGKAEFQFANEIASDNKKNTSFLPPFQQYSSSQMPPTEFLKYISTEEYKDYKYQYKPYIPSRYEQSIMERQIGSLSPSKKDLVLPQNILRGSQSSKSVYDRNMLNTSPNQESLLLEKSQAYLLEQSKMQSKWHSAFKNIDSYDKRSKILSSDNLQKQYKQSNAIILGKIKNLEPSEDEVLVSNNNLQINELLNNLKLKNVPLSVKTPDNYIFQEFMQLSKQSLDIILYQNEYVNPNKQASLKEESKKLNIKLHKMKKENDKFILFKILKSHFQPILDKNKPSIMNRVFLALDINPYEEFSKIKWEQYHLFNKIVIDQSASVIDTINFIVKFFGIHESKYMRKIEFLAILRLICNKFDDFLKSKGRTTIFELLEQNLTVLNLLRYDSEYLSINEFRALLLSHRINYQTLLQLIVLTL